MGFLSDTIGDVLRRIRDEGINEDEQVLFFPSYGFQLADPTTWQVDIHGWIYEPRARPEAPRVAEWLVGEDVEDLLTAEYTDANDPGARFKERIQPFLVDNERGEQIKIDIQDRTGVPLPASTSNGHFQGHVTVTHAQDENRWIAFKAYDEARRRSFEGRAQLLSPTGVSVISDIDDTIKDSNVLDVTQLVLNTFFRAFQPVSGMPALYQTWSHLGACFHYVTGSPWQLYTPLARFFDEMGFPRGSFHMKRVAWDFRTIASLITQNNEVTKKEAIIPLLKRFRSRSFILVGDTTEEDASIYAGLYAEYADRIKKIYIHDVGNEEKRDQAAADLAAIPDDVKLIYTEPARIEEDARSVFA